VRNRWTLARHNAERNECGTRTTKPARADADQVPREHPRNLFGNAQINQTGYTFEDFFRNPQAQIECQLAYQKWVQYNLVCDRVMGRPGGWQWEWISRILRSLLVRLPAALLRTSAGHQRDSERGQDAAVPAESA